MKIILWTLQILLAAQFLQHGIIMVFPPDEYVEIMNATLGIGLRYFIGIAELLAVLGLILPGLLRIYTWLLPLTAMGLMIVTASATVYHASRDEISSAVYTAVLFAVITFVGYMRWKVKPIWPRPKSQSPGKNFES
ncbi:MAG: DoxX family protein [Cyclobacteriaceae bacterium]|nr:DoxX family protein [Cyclobacteriaceae bacterium]MCB0500360.1 DoxX family protein [Cyclobacteriaceae bacterium]MCB9238636.1 DoxX family protein [Flammeovirgaceae bacterium]MCO5271787.1 DoxX family protein [Cyclobacteriaceae bacterium]MCW5901205.1 DoxX family protein [Cyclobacteriaceae bacterium]